MKISLSKAVCGLRASQQSLPKPRLFLKPLLVAASMLAVSGAAHAVEKWGNFDQIRFNNQKYVLGNSQWGRGNLSTSEYWQKIWWNSDTNFGIEWRCPTSGDPRVKGYPGVGMGREWKNNSIYTPNSGLPVQVNWNKNIWTEFGYSLNNYSGQFNAAYDMWFYSGGSTSASTGDVSNGGYSAELMIWTASYWCTPFGTKKGNVNINGRNWDVYHGYAQNFDGNGDNWDVYSFVKTGSWLMDTGTSHLNIKDFINYCRDSIPNAARLNGNHYLHNISFGVEPRLGSGKMDFWKWRCDVVH